MVKPSTAREYDYVVDFGVESRETHSCDGLLPQWTGQYVYEENLAIAPEVLEEKSALPMFPPTAVDRKKVPLASGVMDYFPQALIEVAKVSFAGNQQHNPGQPLHWARGKSVDQDDTIMRHFMERGKFDDDGVRHSAKLAWRALALLQLELEAEGYPKARGAR
jgi:hypothetical protein